MMRILCAAFLTIAALGCAEVKPFTFVHISDPHIGNPGHAENLADALKDIKKTFPETAFIVDTGDLTEFGYPEELKKYSEIVRKSPIKVYPAVGNHDARWSESGKENFKKYIGPTYRKFDHNGVRFVVLDVTMLIEQYAHFDGLQVAQLKKDLESLKEDAPAILAMHHPPLSDGRYFDNEFEFAELIRNYNIPLVCDGHGHAFAKYIINNTTFSMGGTVSSKGADIRSYRVYKVGTDSIELLMRAFDHEITTSQTTIPLYRPKDTIGALTKSEGSGEEHVFKVEMTSGTLSDATYILDGATTGSSSDVAGGEFRIKSGEIPPGDHQIVARLVDDAGTTHVRAAYFRTGGESGPRISREFPLLSGCQSHPTVDGDTLYVAANDTRLRAIDLNSSETVWEADLKREILSAPVVTTDTIVVGSLDSYLYNLSKKDGKPVWKYKAKGAILATPLVTTDTVFVGSGDYNLHAVNLKTGKRKWKFAAQRLIKATPAYAEGFLYFGAWDNNIYCLNARTGKLVWKVPASTSGLFSAATCNPVVAGDNLILVSHDYSVRCLSRKNGSHVWIYKPKKDELGPSYSSPVIHKGVAYMGSINGHMVGHKLDTGEKVFDVNVRPEKTDPLFDSIPTLVKDKLYVGSVGGNLYCVDISDQKVDWKVALQPGFIFTRPAVWKNHVLVGSVGNKVYDVEF